MNNIHRENGRTTGPLIFTVPAYGFVMALYLDLLRQTPSPRVPLRSMQTGQISIAPENSLPQLGQVRCGSVLMDLIGLPRRLKLRNEHGFPRQPAAAWLGNQVRA